MAATSTSSGRCQGVPRLLLLSLGLALLLPPTPTSCIDFEQILGQIFSKVATQVFQKGELELLDHICSYTTKPHFYSWKMYYRCSIWCPGWTPIVGQASGHRRAMTARIEATKDFVKKAVASGLVTEEEADPWL
ncbi:anti-lipopolysaccharide factor-like [Panulirus ornatus]|uniref:anti-lipopolysaccharide factor-like n=1 Tax=Panulirus ornatus TaxID=150431 RepID=UPI003A881B1D